MSDEDQQVSGVNWGWFAILASIITIVGGTTYFLLPSLISKTVTDITVVKAIDAPIKVKPLDPGGEAVDHQDLLVVDILKGGNKADDQTETLRPTSPSPEPPPVAEAETAWMQKRDGGPYNGADGVHCPFIYIYNGKTSISKKESDACLCAMAIHCPAAGSISKI